MNFVRQLACMLPLIGCTSAAVEARGSEAPFVVHEWGTFTAVSASNGLLLTGLEVEEEHVPPFVHSLSGFPPRNKGWSRPVTGVTVKMETPVIYFYSDRPRRVQVDVGFEGGSISQWYPDRLEGEQLHDPRLVAKATLNAANEGAVDFRTGYRGWALWEVEVLPLSTERKPSAAAKLETAQWSRARVPEANWLRGATGEREGFIFYRGLGRFSLPLVARFADDNLTLINEGKEDIGYAFVFECHPERGQRVWWAGPLVAQSRCSVALGRAGGRSSDFEPVRDEFLLALSRAGLSESEAKAMLATWQESYFERAGLRVFWIVPRAFTDRVLPMKLSPAPDRLERVLVGRTEVLTTEFEKELVRDFDRDEGKRWQTDRYFRAYRERAAQLVARAGIAPAQDAP